MENTRIGNIDVFKKFNILNILKQFACDKYVRHALNLKMCWGSSNVFKITSLVVLYISSVFLLSDDYIMSCKTGMILK